MSGYTMTQPELKYCYAGASTNLATFTTEDNLMKTYPACLIPGDYLTRVGKLSSAIKVRAVGQVGTTGTPTFTFSLRLIAGDDSTAWSAGGVLLGSSNAITAGSTVTLAPYQIDLDIGVRTVGAAGGSTTAVVTMGPVSGLGFPTAGYMPAANVSPLVSTVNAGTTYSLFLSAACGTSNAANLINLQMLKVYLEN